MKDVVIVEACRTAVASMGGSLKPLSAYDLACAALKGTLDRSGLDPREVDEVVLGHCRQTSDEPNIARMAALKVGIPETASAYTVMRQCASAMTAVQNGAMSIMCGLNDVVIAVAPMLYRPYISWGWERNCPSVRASTSSVLPVPRPQRALRR